MTNLVFLSAVLAFVTTIYATKWFMRYAWNIGLIVKDQNKRDKPLVPISGGVAVMGGFFYWYLKFYFLQNIFWK